MRIKHYFRYADNIVIFGNSKEQLQKWFSEIRHYLDAILKLEIKSDWQVYNVDIRGVDFVGYVFYHTHTKLRKCIKMRMWKMITRFLHDRLSKTQLKRKIASYLGWLKYCNSKHLLVKIERLTHTSFSNWRGTRTTFRAVKGESIRLIHIEVRQSFCQLQFILKNKPYFIITKSFSLCVELKKYENTSMILGYK